MLTTSAGVEPTTSWSPVGRRIQLSHRGRLVVVVVEVLLVFLLLLLLLISRNIRKLTFWNVRTTKYKSVCASAQSYSSMRFLHGEKLHLWLSELCLVNILIRLCECWSESSLIYKGTFSNVKILFHLRRTVVLSNKNVKLWYHATIELRADNSVKHLLNLPISNPKPDLLHINACTKFG